MRQQDRESLSGCEPDRSWIYESRKAMSEQKGFLDQAPHCFASDAKNRQAPAELPAYVTRAIWDYLPLVQAEELLQLIEKERDKA